MNRRFKTPGDRALFILQYWQVNGEGQDGEAQKNPKKINKMTPDAIQRLKMDLRCVVFLLKFSLLTSSPLGLRCDDYELNTYHFTTMSWNYKTYLMTDTNSIFCDQLNGQSKLSYKHYVLYWKLWGFEESSSGRSGLIVALALSFDIMKTTFDETKKKGR